MAPEKTHEQIRATVLKHVEEWLDEKDGSITLKNRNAILTYSYATPWGWECLFPLRALGNLFKKLKGKTKQDEEDKIKEEWRGSITYHYTNLRMFTTPEIVVEVSYDHGKTWLQVNEC